MRRWKRVVAVLLVAAVALILEGWAASAQAAPALFKKCTYTRTADGTVRPPYSLAPLVGVVKVTVQTNRGTLVLRLDRRGVVAVSNDGASPAVRMWRSG